MRYSISLIVWFISPVLGLFSVFCSIWFSGNSAVIAASYQPAMPSIYFVAVALLTAALADAYEFAAHNHHDQAQGRASLLGALGFVITIG